MKTTSYINGREQEIEIGAELYFGQLYDGHGDEQELLESGSIAVYEETESEQAEESGKREYEERIVDFDIIEKDEENILDTLVRVTDIF